MRFLPRVLCFAALALAAAPAAAKPAYVPSTVNLRAAPGTASEIVGKIPGGSLIDAGDCSEGWCAVTWQGKSGFAIQSALDLSGRVPPRRPPGYAGPPPGYRDGEVVVEGPPVYYEPPPPYYYGYYGPRYRPYWGWRHHW
jgi:Bacterial SH3 domain